MTTPQDALVRRLYAVEQRSPDGFHWKSTGFVFETREKAEAWVASVVTPRRDKYRVSETPVYARTRGRLSDG